MTKDAEDTTLRRLEQRVEDARKHADHTLKTVGGFAYRIAEDELRTAEEAVLRHKRIMNKADAQGWKADT